MIKKKFLGSVRKLRTVSVDSDVIIDVLSLELLRSKTSLSSTEKVYLKRCETSLATLSLLFSVRIKLAGTEVVKKELSYSLLLKGLYEKVFDSTVSLNKQAKRLAKSYLDRHRLKIADSLILALVSVNKIDCLLSWDKSDIVNDKTYEAISKVNISQNLPLPILLTPDEFLKRIALSQERTLAFYPGTIPEQFRLRFSLSRLLL